LIKTKFDELIRKKEYEEGKDFPLRAIAAQTGLAIGTVQRLRKGDVSRVYLSTLDTLCAFFGVKEIGDVLEYVPGTEAQKAEAAE